jgi:hypothetical protein
MKSATRFRGTTFARALVALSVAATFGSTPTVASAATTPDDDARAIRACSYALWYPWYVRNQSRKPHEPQPPKPEPDGPRDPVGQRCLAELAARRQAAGQPQLDDAAITSLRGAAKAGKSAALFQAFDELKASRQLR